MAKILFTAVVADMRNKLNGTVFSKNRYGAYARTKVTPVNPQTTAQQTARNNLATNAQAWRGLTESQRQSWISAAPSFPFTDIFGNSKILSGSALYVKLNSNLANLGIGSLTDAPSPVSIPALLTLDLSVVASTGVVSVQFTPTPIPAGFQLQIFATPNVGPGISFVKQAFRFVGNIASAGASPAVITTEWASLFGAPVLGQKVFIRCALVSSDTGQLGIPLQAQTIVV